MSEVMQERPGTHERAAGTKAMSAPARLPTAADLNAPGPPWHDVAEGMPLRSEDSASERVRHVIRRASSEAAEDGGTSPSDGPSRSPMPRAWHAGEADDDPSRITPRLPMLIAERLLAAGDTARAGFWLSESAKLARLVRETGDPSWAARRAVAVARLELMHAYEAAHGRGCLLNPAHRDALARRWSPSPPPARADVVTAAPLLRCLVED